MGAAAIGNSPEWHEDKALDSSFWSLKGSDSPAQGRAKRRPGLRSRVSNEALKGRNTFLHDSLWRPYRAS